MKHFELCKLTAERFIKKSDIAFYEYQIMGAVEHPDVLTFKNSYSTLFEIKVNYTDFLKDKNKICRIKYTCNYFLRMKGEHDKIYWENRGLKEFIKEKPHLGRKRFYVCVKGLIQPEEVGSWGLYWYHNDRFYLKKESKIFRHNSFYENKILVNAIKRLSAGFDDNILIKNYEK